MGIYEPYWMKGRNKTSNEKKKNTSKKVFKEPEKKITDGRTENVYGIMIMNQNTINKIYKNSGPLAVREEFQMHYTALTTRIELDGQLLFINVPVLFYNYEQFVSTGAVKFNYGTVQEISDAVMPLAQAQAQLFLEKESTKHLDKVIETIFSSEPNWEITTMHTMHRHPGQMDNFSGIDYKKNFDNPGIVFPIMDCEPNTPSFSSIICDYKDTMKLVHTECRIATTTPEEIQYKQGKSATFISGHKYEANILDKIFGFEKEDIKTYSIEKDRMTVPAALTTALLNSIATFDVDCQFIQASNVKTNSKSGGGYYGNNYRNNDILYSNRNLFDDEDEYHKYKKEEKITDKFDEMADKMIEESLDLIEKNGEIYCQNNFTGAIDFNEKHKDFSIETLRKVLSGELVKYEYEIDSIEKSPNSEFFNECVDIGIIEKAPKI